MSARTRKTAPAYRPLPPRKGAPKPPLSYTAHALHSRPCVRLRLSQELLAEAAIQPGAWVDCRIEDSLATLTQTSGAFGWRLTAVGSHTAELRLPYRADGPFPEAIYLQPLSVLRAAEGTITFALPE